MKRLLLSVFGMARPSRGDMKQCSTCQTWNEPDRTTCIGCGESF